MNESKRGLLDIPSAYLGIMKSAPKYKWFKPIVAALVAFAVYIAVVGTISGFALLFGVSMPGLGGHAVVSGQYLKIDLTDPLQIAFTALSIGAMGLAACLGAKALGIGGYKSLSSVAGGLRWHLIAKIVLPLFLLTAVLVTINSAITLGVDGRLGELSSMTFAPAGLLAIVVFFPLQCAGEEYVFRGFLAQALGSWIPSAIIAIIVQGVLFGAVHGYDLAGNLSIVLNGILWGWLTAKTGGLEASICLHATNNVFVFLMNSVFVCTTVTVSNSLGSVFLDVVGVLLTTAFAYYLCKKNGYLLESKK